MNLLELRRKFRDLSGRFDLVNEDGSDNGANFFINEGRKFLDRLDETQKSWASCFRFINVGGFSAQFPYCRAIKEVWVASTTERWQLVKISLQDLIASYMADLPGERTTGTPAYYSPALTRYSPANADLADLESFLGWVDIPSGPSHEYNSILINVPTDTKIVADIKGLFYSAELSNDNDSNHWSVNNPSLLVMAAMRFTEVFNRNRQGVNDWDTAIAVEMKQLGMDLVEEIISEVDQMEG